MIALFSGGLDSTAAVLLHRNEVDTLLHVQYGQRHGRAEQIHAQMMANYLTKPLEIVTVPSLPWEGDTVVGRNLVLIALAASFAGADRRVLVGCCQEDAAGFPDCRPEFLAAAGKVANVEVVAPLLHKPKAFAFYTLRCHNIPHHDTHTCYTGDHTTRHDWGYGCGECGSCIIRAAAWS